MTFPDDDTLICKMVELGRVDALLADLGVTDHYYRQHLRTRPGLRQRMREARDTHKKNQVIAAIRAWHERHGRLPGFDDYDVGVVGPYAIETVLKIFGSWNQAVTAAGFTPRQPGPPGLYPDDLERAAEVFTRPIKDREAAEALGITADQARRRRVRLGYDKPLAQWTRERVIEAIKRWAGEYGNPPAATDWNNAGRGANPTTSTVLKLFGTWNAGIAAAGFTPRQVGKYNRKNRRVKPASA